MWLSENRSHNIGEENRRKWHDVKKVVVKKLQDWIRILAQKKDLVFGNFSSVKHNWKFFNNLQMPSVIQKSERRFFRRSSTILPTAQGCFCLITDENNDVGVSGIMHEEHEWSGGKMLNSVLFLRTYHRNQLGLVSVLKIDLFARQNFLKKVEKPVNGSYSGLSPKFSWPETYTLD